MRHLPCSYFVFPIFHLCRMALKMKRQHYRQAIFAHISTLVKENGGCDPVCPPGNSLKSPSVSEYAVLHDHTSPFLTELNYSLLYHCHEKTYQSFASKVMPGVILNALWGAKRFLLSGDEPHIWYIHWYPLKSKVKHYDYQSSQV